MLSPSSSWEMEVAGFSETLIIILRPHGTTSQNILMLMYTTMRTTNLSLFVDYNSINNLINQYLRMEVI
jgi:hypothetical protein